MKAKPVKLNYGVGWEQCEVEEATHVMLRIPGPSDRLVLPVILKGTREGTHCWSWNGDTEKPTLKPSVLTNARSFRCHSWINDGKAIFLDDCTHEFVSQTMDLLDVE